MTPRRLERGVAPGGDRSAHRLRVGVDGEEGHAERHDALHRAGDGVVDVEKLGVEEDLLAGHREVAGEVDAAGIDELQPDLVEADAVAEPRHHGLGGAGLGQVERDDQAVIGGNRQHGANCRRRKGCGQGP